MENVAFCWPLEELPFLSSTLVPARMGPRTGPNEEAGVQERPDRGLSPGALCCLRCLLDKIRGPQRPVSGSRVIVQKTHAGCLQ